MGVMGKYLPEFTDEYMKFAFLISVDYTDTWKSNFIAELRAVMFIPAVCIRWVQGG